MVFIGINMQDIINFSFSGILMDFTYIGKSKTYLVLLLAVSLNFMLWQIGTSQRNN